MANRRKFDIIDLNFLGAGLSYNLPGCSNWHHLYNNSDDKETPETQREMLAALDNVVLCTDHFVDGDMFRLGGRIIGRLEGLSVEPVLLEESKHIYRAHGMPGLEGLSHPGTILIRFAGADEMSLTVTSDSISISSNVKTGEPDDVDFDNAWDGAESAIMCMIRNCGIAFRSIEFEQALLETLEAIDNNT